MNPDHVATVLWIALAIIGAVCVYVLYRVARIVYEIISFVRRDRLPKPQLMHPELGLMTYYEGIWTADCQCGERRIQCAISGNKDGPASELTSRAAGLLNEIEHFERLAVDFLLKSPPEYMLMPDAKRRLDRETFRLGSICCLWEEKPDEFCLEFELEGDPAGIWRVEFKGDVPVFTGRDD